MQTLAQRQKTPINIAKLLKVLTQCHLAARNLLHLVARLLQVLVIWGEVDYFSKADFVPHYFIHRVIVLKEKLSKNIVVHYCEERTDSHLPAQDAKEGVA